VPISKGLYTFLVCAQTICYYLVWPTHSETPNHPHSSPHSRCLTVTLLSCSPCFTRCHRAPSLSLCSLAATALLHSHRALSLSPRFIRCHRLLRCHPALSLSSRSLAVTPLPRCHRALAVKREGEENKREGMKEWVTTR
jgi:hypothetical protein